MYDQRIKNYKLCAVAMLTQHQDILVKKTYNRDIERFTWNGVMKDVKQVVSDVFFLYISCTVTYYRYLHVISTVKE